MSGDFWRNGGAEAHNTQTTNTATPQQFNWVTPVWEQASRIAPYSGPQIGAQSPYTVQAQQMMAQKATDPNSLTAQAQRQYGSTIAGDYMNPNSNPFFQNYVNDALGQAKSQILSTYGGNSGVNVNNSGFQEALARGLGSQAMNAYSNLYNTERQNQLSATAAAPNLDYSQANALFGVGASQEARSQAEVDAQKQQYIEQWNNLGRYLNMLQGNYGGITTQQTPYFTNPFAQLLGMFGFGKGAVGVSGGGAGNGGSAGGGEAAAGGGVGGGMTGAGDLMGGEGAAMMFA